MTPRLAALLIALFVVFGCGGESERAPAAPAASTSTQAKPPVAVRPAADALVSELYRRHAAGDTPFFQTEDRGKVDAFFEPALAELIWKDAVASQGEVGAIEFDPLYNAQETEIKNLVIHPAEAHGSGARVLVTFENLGTAERVMYMLVPAGDNWRISDIDYGEHFTLRGILASAGQVQSSAT